jgi:hypothetical protein
MPRGTTLDPLREQTENLNCHMYREAVLPSPICSYRRGHRRRGRGEATEKIVTLKVKRVRAGGRKFFAKRHIKCMYRRLKIMEDKKKLVNNHLFVLKCISKLTSSIHPLILLFILVGA